MSTRALQRVIESIPATEGAGVKLKRSLGQTPHARLDPFLMLDEFSSDNPDDYVAGFPSHPHRGFETVTYMLAGHLRHEDHLGHRGDLKAGGVQWMSAGRGIVHSEMPQQTEGRMHGFQLWINLPAREKMKPASYRDIDPSEIPIVTLAGGRAKVIAGKLRLDGHSIAGPIQGLSTDPLYLDVALRARETFVHPIASDYAAFLYPYEGEIDVGSRDAPRSLKRQCAGLLSNGDRIEVTAGCDGARFLVLAGRPLNEPIVQYGPFVMNSVAEVEQAIRDYQTGELTRYGA